MIYRILVGGTIATIAMTLFSLLISVVFNRLYREPILINGLLPEKIGKYSLVGYFIHLAVGWALALIYYALMEIDIILLSFQSGLFFGLIAGVAATVAWKMFFKMSKSPPDINLIGYFFQLVIAHLIFGGTLAWVVLQ